MPDFSVPRWLQPPSQGEERQIRLLEQEAQQKAGTMLRRYIGMRRADSEAKQAVANGVDPLTARQNALLNNASLIFADNPKSVSDMLNHEEANQVRESANLQLAQHRRTQDLLRADAIQQARERLDAQDKWQTEKMGLQRDVLSNRQDTAEARLQLERERLENAKTKLSPAAQEGRDVASIQQQLRDAETELQSSGVGVLKPEATKPLRDKIQNLRDQLNAIEARRGYEETTVEPGGIVKITRGKTAGSDLGGGVRSELQKQLASGATTMDTISQTLPKISQTTVGPVGVLKENLETLANIINPGSVKPESTEARALMRIGTQEIVSAMKQPGMVSNYERRMLNEIGDVTGFYESAPTATRKMEILRSLLAAKAVRTSKMLKQAVPDQALMYLPRDLAEQLRTEGQFSIDDARRWYRIHKAMEKSAKSP